MKHGFLPSCSIIYSLHFSCTSHRMCFHSKIIRPFMKSLETITMVQLQTPFLFFFPLLILSTTSPVYAIRHQKLNSETSSVFSLPLHPHDSIENPQNLNYTSRAIHQLESDIARVKYINSRLKNALFNSNRNFQQEDIWSPLPHMGGVYSARIGVGKPVKQFYLIADTGSHVNWLQCKPCTRCYPQVDPIFNPSKSSTYRPLRCSSQQCNALKSRRSCRGNATCTYFFSYGSGTANTTGNLATETLSFWRSGSVNNVAIGCGRDNQGDFHISAGLIGLGASDLALPSQIKASSFSYCLVGFDSKSSSTLDFNSAPPADSIIVPFRTIRDVVYYYVEISGITVGKDKIPIPPSVYQIRSDGTGGIIVDSGTTDTFLDSQVYSSLRDAFRRNTKNLVRSRRSFQGYDTCYDVPSSTASRVKGPSMSFQFSNGKSTPPLGPQNYLKHVADSAFCLAFQPTDESPSILGNKQQTGMRITFNLHKKLVGFSPHKC